ncbi:hypothetical protein INS49_000722 [Diaporthe citri]|uniref:uncharacterized protein n=1 Tax=Diaporthe citri TaxID=83186 RepID=UPI001C811D0F|nr:uncharacterized protein INS49_000722 [Diaporthe citri]KAG6366545.1 hypothetical protein INS49_000722 [Diaporthe citri]
MVLDIDPANVLRERDLETVEYDLYRSAAELAVLGEVESARDLEITFDANYLEKCLATIRGNAGTPYPVGTIVKALAISLTLNSGPARNNVFANMDLVKMVAAGWSRRLIDALVVAEQLWPYYICGLLADTVGIGAEELRSKGENLVRAFSARLSRGYVENRLESKTLKELLDIGEKNTLTGPGLRRWKEMGGGIPETMFKKPATREQISELESRLETHLTQDYKGFLSITNGFGSGDDMQEGVYNGYFLDPELFATDKVAWLSEDWIALPFEMLKIPREIEDPYRKPSEAWDTAMPLLNRVVHIGNRDIDDLWLVHPDLVQKAKRAYLEMLENGDEMQKKILQRAMKDFAGSMERFTELEWCCVKNSSGGAATSAVFSSFRSYLESVVEASGEDKMSSTNKPWYAD